MKRILILALIVMAVTLKGDQPADWPNRNSGSFLIETFEVIGHGHVTATEHKNGAVVVEYAAKAEGGVLIMGKETVVAGDILVAGDECRILRIGHKDGKGELRHTVIAVENKIGK